jgi:hypothetical protein
LPWLVAGPLIGVLGLVVRVALLVAGATPNCGTDTHAPGALGEHLASADQDLTVLGIDMNRRSRLRPEQATARCGRRGVSTRRLPTKGAGPGWPWPAVA